MFINVSQLLALLGRLSLNTGHVDSNPSIGKCVLKVIANQPIYFCDKLVCDTANVQLDVTKKYIQFIRRFLDDT